MARAKMLEVEALELARNQCVGDMYYEHILELRRLAKVQLVRNVDTGHSAYYVLTEKGQARLEASCG